VHGTERKISGLLHVNDLKLLGRNENDFQNEIHVEIVQAASKNINMNFGFE
jgi:hypothetical protein